MEFFDGLLWFRDFCDQSYTQWRKLWKWPRKLTLNRDMERPPTNLLVKGNFDFRWFNVSPYGQYRKTETVIIIVLAVDLPTRWIAKDDNLCAEQV